MPRTPFDLGREGRLIWRHAPKQRISAHQQQGHQGAHLGPQHSGTLPEMHVALGPYISAPCLICPGDMPTWQMRLVGRIAIPVILQRNHDAAPRKKSSG